MDKPIKPPRSAPQLKTPDEIALMREAGRIVARAHQAMREALRPGITTAQLDRIAESVIRDHGAIPVFKGYPKPKSPNYPASINASINDEIVHGIPSDKRSLREGDIISLDTACSYQGFVGDSAWSYAIGEVSTHVQRLLAVGEQALMRAIEASVIPNEVRDIARAIQTFVEGQGYSVIRDYTGHGVGRKMHEEPEIPNWWSDRKMGSSLKLAVGMTFAIEPMVVAGRPDTRELADQWTVVTKDRSLAVHFEHTIAITDGAPQILTLL